ncbi:MAG: DUF4198 domain-containing protein [Phycisphaerae bacterium]
MATTKSITQRRQCVLAVVLSLATFATSHAHEFWIEPSTFRPNADQRVDVALRVGEKFKGESVVRKADRIERFAVCARDATSEKAHESPIAGTEGKDPAGEFTAQRPGLNIVIYDSNHARVELASNKFDAYLKEKGLDAIRRERAQQGEGSAAVREIYSRCAKALIMVQGAGANGAPARDLETGMPLEIVAGFDPYADAPPSAMRVHVLFHGKPLADVQVTARSRKTAESVQTARSDKDGEATFQLTDSGPWLVECTHMRPAGKGADADYESFWASLTFDAPSAAKQSADPKNPTGGK